MSVDKLTAIEDAIVSREREATRHLRAGIVVVGLGVAIGLVEEVISRGAVTLPLLALLAYAGLASLFYWPGLQQCTHRSAPAPSPTTRLRLARGRSSP